MKNNISQASELRSNADTEIRKIQSDRDLTETAKANRIAQIRSKTNGELSALQSGNAKAKAEMRDQLHRNLFGLGFPLGATEGDKQSARLNYRDALFRADSIADEAAALRLLGRAQMTGDKELAKAIAARSYEQGWSRALNEYGAQSEAIQSNLRELVNFEQDFSSSRIKMNESISFSQLPETPEETKARLSGETIGAE
jgi:hypothetical protein